MQYRIVRRRTWTTLAGQTDRRCFIGLYSIHGARSLASQSPLATLTMQSSSILVSAHLHDYYAKVQ